MKCPVCLSDADMEEKDMGRYFYVDCPKCGVFEWDKDIQRYLQSYREHQTLLSYWIRNNQDKRETIHLNDKLVEEIVEKTELPSPTEKAHRLLLLVGSKLQQPDQQLFFTPQIKLELITKIGAHNESEFAYIVNYLKSNGWIESNIDYKPGADNIFHKGTISMTFQGWSKHESLMHEDSDSKLVFMAMDFKDANVEKAYQDYFKQAVANTGFKLYNLKEKPRAGLIDNRLRAEIRKSRFLLADLTNDNLGAYWEAGFAEGLNKPVIYLCEKSHFENFKTHFDTNHHFTVIYDMDNLEDASEQLKSTIRATLPFEAKMNDA